MLTMPRNSIQSCNNLPANEGQLKYNTGHRSAKSTIWLKNSDNLPLPDLSQTHPIWCFLPNLIENLPQCCPQEHVGTT